MIKAAILVLISSGVLFGQTSVKFSADPGDTPTSAYRVGPFPTNALTVTAPAQPTGLLTNLPASEDSCGSGVTPVCSAKALLNQLDGFSLNPRAMVCFSAPVDPSTLAAGIAFVPVPNSTAAPTLAGSPGLVQTIVDPATNCAFAKPSQVLNQSSQYLLVVTGAVRDSNSQGVTADPNYASCVDSPSDTYCRSLSAAVNRLVVPSGTSVAAASLFTTMTATSWLEQARRFVDLVPTLTVPAGVVSTFALNTLRNITWVPDKSATGPQNIPLTALTNVGSVSFGLALAPNYINTFGPTAGSITTPPILPVSYNPVSYHVFLPAKSAGKIPVVIYGHGLGDSQFGAPTYIASTLARNGFATLALEITGHGFGPNGFVKLTNQNGAVFTVFTPGRGVQLVPGTNIGPIDGCIAPGAVAIRDCARQTAVDLSVIVHAIRTSNGLGLNLDPDRIFYIGQSLGSISGTLFNAVEPAVQTAVLNGAGGTSVDIARLALTSRSLGLLYLSSLKDPSLFNVLTLGAPPPPYFHTDIWNDNYVYRDQSPVTNTVPGALAVQSAFEAADWVNMLGDPLAFAPHLKTSPLPGVPPKNILFQFGFGDLEVPNPTESAVVMAANAAASVSFFNFQNAVAIQPQLLGVMDPAVPGLPILPHRVLSNPTIFDPANSAELSIALAEQQQTADYFLSNGTSITNPNQYLTSPFQTEDPLFATPPAALPQRLNFLQIQP